MRQTIGSNDTRSRDDEAYQINQQEPIGDDDGLPGFGTLVAVTGLIGASVMFG